MSNYSKTTDFAAKDSLPSGDSGKIIRGSEFETEFDNISTAIATKADAADPTFTGTVTIDGLTVNGNTVLGNAATDTVTVTADIASNLIPSADDTYNLGASGAEWNDLFIDGTANIDSLVADTADINGGTIDGVTIGGSSAGAITGTAISGTSFASTGNMTFGDNNKAIFGASNDLQIYHDGTDTQIREVGAGNLKIITDGAAVQIQSTLENMIVAQPNAGVQLFYDNSQKLTTNSTGVDVTGTVTADGLTVDGSATINSAAPVLSFTETDTTDLNTLIENSSGNLNISTRSDDGGTKTKRIRVAHSTGDVSFYEDTGTTAKFFWDASTERLGIGTTSPTEKLDVTGTAKTDGLTVDGAAQFNTGATGIAEFYHVSGLGGVRITGSAGGSSSTLFLANDKSGGGNDIYALYGNGSNDSLQLYSGGTSGTGTLRAQFASNGDISFFEDTGSTTKFRWKAAEERLGIGTTNPQHDLDVVSVTSANASVRIEGGANLDSSLQLTESGNSGFKFTYDGGDNKLYIGSGTSGTFDTRMTLERDSGNVGIGTSSPSAKLQVDDGAGSALFVGFSNSNYYRSGQHVFQSLNNTSEYMRIDSSGNLLVGKTAENTSQTDGVEARADGRLYSTTDGTTVAKFNRRTSDGPIVDFRKDNSKIGSIGVTLADNMFLAGNSSHVGIAFGGGTVYGVDSTGAIDDGNVDLGSASGRFKDLYLSGGAHLGGTAAANKLDDYEEGTWTPVYAPSTGSFTTMTMDIVNATYTKVGSIVTVNVFLRTDNVDVGTASGNLKISGIPFAASGYNSVHIGYSHAFTGNHPSHGWVQGSQITLRYRTSANTTSLSLNVSDLETGATANRNVLLFTATYETTA